MLKQITDLKIIVEVGYKMSKTVLITGASGGIGKELANRFVEDRYNMVLVARSEGKLEEVGEVGEVADEAYRDFLRGKPLIIPGAVHRFITSLPRLLPRKVMARLIRERTARVER
jgi:short-subunit dehydrogenase